MGLFSVLAPVVGSLIGNSMTNSANKAAAGDANDFTTSMMSNRHQMEVADLRAAGLNPILSAGGSPSMGNAAKADVESSGEAMARGVSAAAQLSLLKSQIENIKEDTALKKASQVSQLAGADAATAQARNTNINALTSETMLGAVASGAKNLETENKTWLSRVIRPRTKAFFDTIGDATGAIGNVFRGSSSSNTSTVFKGK